MPIVVGIGVIAVIGIGILLFSGSASAASGSRTGGKAEEKSGVKVVVKIPKYVVPPAEDITPIPTPGHYYRIVVGDIGSQICVRAYGSERPTARWLHVAADPKNTVRLARAWSDWFLPRWNKAPGPVFSSWAGVFTGQYAVIWLPLASEVPV
jgi:hypothetical protein